MAAALLGLAASEATKTPSATVDHHASYASAARAMSHSGKSHGCRNSVRRIRCSVSLVDTST